MTDHASALSRIKTPERPHRKRQTTGSGPTWLPADQVPGGVLSPQAQRELDEKLRALDEWQARSRVSGASYVIY